MTWTKTYHFDGLEDEQDMLLQDCRSYPCNGVNEMNALNAAQRMQMIEKFETLTMSEYGALVSENEQLRQRVAELEKEVAHWKNNHETEVRRARILKERTDMPIERVQAYEQWGKDMAERDKATQYWQIAEGRCDALKQQRDELLAALGSGGRHCNDDTPHSNLCEAIIDSKEADLGQGLDPFWKWAFRRGFHEAETSYKVDITTLEQQRDELLAALEKFLDDNNPEGFGCACEPGRLCGPCSEAKRQRPLYAAIASVKEKQNEN